MSNWFFHDDVLARLSEDAPLAQKLEAVHGYVRSQFPKISRVAVALYDEDTDMLKTFAHASEGASPLAFYEATLAGSASLSEIARRRQARVVNDTDIYGEASAHSRKIRGGGYGSSYTLPIFRGGDFIGFLFFNAAEKEAFDERSLHFFDLLGHLLALMVIDSLATTKALVATVRTATGLAQHRDFETGAHMDRMAYYARLIAKEIAPKYGLTDTDVEHIFLFAPLHDIGKISVPDDIMLKQGKLTEDEFAVMKTHAQKGFDLIDGMLANFKLDGVDQSNVLRNIALYHHEAMNGSGYPCGIKGDEIPIEARIAGVADVFDALTSVRPYKRAWSVDEAFQFLIENADSRFDRDCVAALVKHREDIERIQEQFAEDRVG
jgi:HD-GYP domain-containing protein (c-di-GMP phosphodiesterase class II)